MKFDPAIMPARLKGLPIAENGYPVPYFTAYLNGKPDFRVVDQRKKSLAAIRKLCWICGVKIVYPATYCFVGGPLCVSWRVFGDGPSHHECAEFAMRVCPFIACPTAKRRDHSDLVHAGVCDDPLCTINRPEKFCLYETHTFTWHPKERKFYVGSPVRVQWWKDGQPMSEPQTQV